MNTNIHTIPSTRFVNRPLRAVAKATALAAMALCLGSMASGIASAATEPVVVHSFTGGSGGALPYSPVLQASDGFLYGATYYGSASGSDLYSGFGTLYRMKPDGSAYRTLYVFTGQADGGTPIAPLLQGKDGALYGVAFSGDSAGPAPNGTIYKLSKAGKFSVLHTFTGLDGAYVDGGLVQDSDGTLYGVGQGGGSLGYGTIYSLSPDGSNFKLLHEFDGGLGGSTPKGRLTLGSDGRLYGVGNDGGPSLDGVVFSIAKDGTGYKTVHQFASVIGEGRRPHGGPTQGADGYFYGTTNAGGAADCLCGTVYKVNAAGDFQTLHSFAGEYDGSAPTAPPTFGPNGHLYGTAFGGGANVYFGTAWEMDTTGKLVGVVPFTSTASALETGLTLARDGLFYGTSLNGGSANVGTVYTLDPSAFPAPVLPVPTVGIGATPGRIKLGKKALLSWGASEPSTCVASDAWSGQRNTSGSRYVSPKAVGDYTYTLTCTNTSGSTSASTTLKVVAP
ncbi:MAG TPA: choice-of-anchor tandem repeat GloVer-containing protein [Ideonella sp.]|nr:choice-of-anchor tandem repeat GloVer-containing protein [Ideonella sp.]